MNLSLPGLALVVVVLAHFLHDYRRFVKVQNDIKWIKSALRKHDISAPNGDDD